MVDLFYMSSGNWLKEMIYYTVYQQFMVFGMITIYKLWGSFQSLIFIIIVLKFIIKFISSSCYSGWLPSIMLRKGLYPKLPDTFGSCVIAKRSIRKMGSLGSTSLMKRNILVLALGSSPWSRFWLYGPSGGLDSLCVEDLGLWPRIQDWSLALHATPPTAASSVLEPWTQIFNFSWV